MQAPSWGHELEVSDLEEKIEERVDRALRYACRSWHKHLVDTVPVHIVPVLHHFLGKIFLFLLEVLCVLSATREAVDALGAAARFPDVRCVSLPALFQKLNLTGTRTHRLSTSSTVVSLRNRILRSHKHICTTHLPLCSSRFGYLLH